MGGSKLDALLWDACWTGAFGDHRLEEGSVTTVAYVVWSMNDLKSKNARFLYLKTPNGGGLNIKMWSYQHRDPLIKIRWSCDCFIFNMGIPIPGSTVFILRGGPTFRHIGDRPG